MTHIRTSGHPDKISQIKIQKPSALHALGLKIKSLCFLQLQKLEKRKYSYFFHFQLKIARYSHFSFSSISLLWVLWKFWRARGGPKSHIWVSYQAISWILKGMKMCLRFIFRLMIFIFKECSLLHLMLFGG